jgi:hypothetical protein
MDAVGADRKLRQGFNLPSCFLMWRGSRSDHHGHGRQNPAAAQPRQEVSVGNLSDDRAVGQYDSQVAPGAIGGRAQVPAKRVAGQMPAFHELLKQALKAD